MAFRLQCGIGKSGVCGEKLGFQRFCWGILQFYFGDRLEAGKENTPVSRSFG